MFDKLLPRKVTPINSATSNNWNIPSYTYQCFHPRLISIFANLIGEELDLIVVFSAFFKNQIFMNIKIKNL